MYLRASLFLVISILLTGFMIECAEDKPAAKKTTRRLLSGKNSAKKSSSSPCSLEKSSPIKENTRLWFISEAATLHFARLLEVETPGIITEALNEYLDWQRSGQDSSIPDFAQHWKEKLPALLGAKKKLSFTGSIQSGVRLKRHCKRCQNIGPKRWLCTPGKLDIFFADAINRGAWVGVHEEGEDGRKKLLWNMKKQDNPSKEEYLVDYKIVVPPNCLCQELKNYVEKIIADEGKAVRLLEQTDVQGKEETIQTIDDDRRNLKSLHTFIDQKEWEQKIQGSPQKTKKSRKKK